MGEPQLHTLGTESYCFILNSCPMYASTNNKALHLYHFNILIPSTNARKSFSAGDNYENVKVGQLCTPVGTIRLSVSYRTKMSISPTHTGRDSIMLKSDHFHSDLSPRHARYQQR